VERLIVARAALDRAELEHARCWLSSPTPLDEMLNDPSLKIILEIVACRLMQRRSQVDVKKLQANDNE
jgi:hypothetical protein